MTTPTSNPPASPEIVRPEYEIGTAKILKNERFRRDLKEALSLVARIGGTPHGRSMMQGVTDLSGASRFDYASRIVRSFCYYLAIQIRRDVDRGRDPFAATTPNVLHHVELALNQTDQLSDVSPFPVIYFGIRKEVERFATAENLNQDTAFFTADFLVDSMLPNIDLVPVRSAHFGRESLKELLMDTPFKFCGSQKLPEIAEIETACSKVRVEDLVRFIAFLSNKATNERASTTSGFRDHDIPRVKEILIILAEIVKKRFARAMATFPDDVHAQAIWFARMDNQVVNKLSEPWALVAHDPKKAFAEIKKMPVIPISGLNFGPIAGILAAVGKGISDGLKKIKPAAAATAEVAAHGAAVAATEAVATAAAKAAAAAKKKLKPGKKLPTPGHP